MAGHEERTFRTSLNGDRRTDRSWRRNGIEGVRRRITELSGTWQRIPVPLDPGR